MFNIEELRQIIQGRKLHWSVKSTLLYNFHKQQRDLINNWSREKTAYDLNISVKYVDWAIKLAQTIQRYPSFANFHTRREAMCFISNYGNDLYEFRKQINLMSVKLESIKNKMRVIKYDNRSKNSNENSIDDRNIARFEEL